MNLDGIRESPNIQDHTMRTKMENQVQYHWGDDLNDYELGMMKKHNWSAQDMMILRYITSPDFHRDAMDYPRVPDRRAP